MLELDSLVDGVTAPTNGTPESAAAIRAASEGTAGVRDDGGGLGGGGAGAASFAVGEQLQNMVLGVLGSTLGMGSEAAGCPSDGSRRAERCVAKVFSPLPSSQGQWCGQLSAESLVGFKIEEGF